MSVVVVVVVEEGKKRTREEPATCSQLPTGLPSPRAFYTSTRRTCQMWRTARSMAPSETFTAPLPKFV